MRVLEQEDLAILLHSTHHTAEDWSQAYRDAIRPTWEQEAEFNRDDYRAWAGRILKQARVGLFNNVDKK